MAKAKGAAEIGVIGDEALMLRLVRGLNETLSNLSDLAAAYKQAHWNILGPSFTQLHELTDRFAGQTREYIDLVAERAVAVGGVAHGTIQAAVKTTSLPPFPLEERDEEQLLTALVASVRRTVEELRRAADGTEADLVTQDLYLEVLHGTEKQLWMLQAHLAR